MLWVYDVCQCCRCWVWVQYAHTVLYADLLVHMRQQPQLFDLLLASTPRPPSTLLAAVSGNVIAPSCRHCMELSSPALVEFFVVQPKPQIVAVLFTRTFKDIRMPGVKSETFSDEWHVRVYSHAANACHRTASERQILVYPSRMIGYPSRVFPPRDVLSSLSPLG